MSKHLSCAWSTVLMFLFFIGTAVGAECGASKVFDFGERAVYRAGQALLFTSPVAINLDGAPNAYHPVGTAAGALDTLCNAGKAFPAGEAPYHGSAPGRCLDFLAHVREAAAADWTGATRIQWYGIVTEDAAGNVPCKQETGEFAGYFVSATALTNEGKKKCDPARYLDSRDVPFVVLPRNSAFLSDHKVALGDLSVVFDPRSGKAAMSVVGDIGPAKALGEVSVAAAQALRNTPITPLTRNAVRRLATGEPVLTVVFPASKIASPYSAEKVGKHAQEQLAAWGGLERLRSCARELTR